MEKELYSNPASSDNFAGRNSPFMQEERLANNKVIKAYFNICL